MCKVALRCMRASCAAPPMGFDVELAVAAAAERAMHLADEVRREAQASTRKRAREGAARRGAGACACDAWSLRHFVAPRSGLGLSRLSPRCPVRLLVRTRPHLRVRLCWRTGPGPRAL